MTGFTLSVTVALYVAFGVKLFRRRLPGNQEENNVAQSEVVARRVVRMMASVVLVFCVCCCPHWVLSTACSINPLQDVCRNPDARFVKFVGAYSNSAITSFIYPLYSANFRFSFKQILRDLFCRRRGRVSPQRGSLRKTKNRGKTIETELQRLPASN